MVETALSTAAFAVLVFVFFCLMIFAVVLALAGIGLLIGFIDHLWQNHKARKHMRGK